MARTSGRSADRAKQKRRAARREAGRAVARATSQMLVVLGGGVAGGGLIVLAAFPDAIDPVPSIGCLVAASLVVVGTLLLARRLEPYVVERR